MRNVDRIPYVLPVRITIIRSINPEIDWARYTFGTHSFEFRDGPLPLVDLLWETVQSGVRIYRVATWSDTVSKLQGNYTVSGVHWNYLETLFKLRVGRLIHHFGKLTRFNNLPPSEKTIDQIFLHLQKRSILSEKCHKFFLPAIVSLLDGRAKWKSMYSFHNLVLIILFLCDRQEMVTTIVMKFYRHIVYPSLRILSFDFNFFLSLFWLITLYTAVKNRARFITNNAVLFFHFDIESGWKYFHRKFRGKNTRLISRQLFPLSFKQELELLLSVHSSFFEKWIFFLSSFPHLFCRKRSSK